MRMLALTNTALALSTLATPGFDFYRFAQFHDGTTYTIHGSWPTREDGSWPEFCPGPRFNQTQLQPLEVRLRRDWPNWFGSSQALHRHEYLRHGTCSGLTEFDYFSHCLDAYDSYDLNQIVPPSKLPPLVEDLTALFLHKYGVPLTVDRDRHGRASEVSFCLDKAWTLMACP